MPLILPANTLADTGYNIDNSIRINDADNAYLSWTPGSDGDLDKWTLSMWVKRTTISTYDYTFTVEKPSAGDNTVIVFYSDDGVRFEHYDGSQLGMLTTNRKLRDPNAWYHIVFVWDTGNGTAGNRQRMYINGVEETSFATDTNPSSGRVSFVSDASYVHWIGRGITQSESNNFDGYLAEIAFCDGQTYAASDFGEFDEDSGIWKPKKLDVTFGSQGYYLEFKQSGTGTDSSGIGADTSGNTNHWAVTNLAATDQTTDTPTNNFCVLNAINPTEANASFTEGNLKFTNTLNSSPHHGLAHGTMAVAKGKWYWEVRVDAIGGTAMGIGAEEVSAFGKNNVAGNQGISLFNHGYTHQRGSDVAVSGDTTYTTNDIIGVALDMDNRKIYFHKDGTYFNSGDPTSGATGTGAISLNAADVTMTPAVSNYNTGIQNCNFGNPQWTVSSTQADDAGYGNFEYDVPAGYYALCTKNLAEYG